MKLHCLREFPQDWLGHALERFEKQFDYPLGSSRFRISHGSRYLPFFQSMGPPHLLVAEDQGEVLGTLARVERHLAGDHHVKAVRMLHYLADLKIVPRARGGRILSQLMHETRRQILASGSQACYAVIMGGTGRLPSDYTGRIGIPSFANLAEIVILRLSLIHSGTPLPVCGEGEDPLPRRPSLRLFGGDPSLRSKLNPTELKVRESHGLLEDTRLGKQLWDLDGHELKNAHVSNLHFEFPSSAALLLREACLLAESAGFAAVFTSMPRRVWEFSRAAFIGFQIQEAPAMVFGHDLPESQDWWVDTSEI